VRDKDVFVDLVCFDKSIESLLFSCSEDKFKTSKIEFFTISPSILVLNETLFRNIIDLSVWHKAIHAIIDCVIDIDDVFVEFNDVLCSCIVFDEVFKDIAHVSFEFHCDFIFQFSNQLTISEDRVSRLLIRFICLHLYILYSHSEMYKILKKIFEIEQKCWWVKEKEDYRKNTI
jgi:hypothetical protein